MTFPSASTPFCEVRVTTYKRPDLLKRALTSLQEQTYPFWKAIVLDDSPEREGADVVRKINDLRIIYRANPKNLGRNKNIDFAFQSRNIIGGRYACILEDDNYFFPDFIESNIQSLTREKVNIVLRNQEIRVEGDDGRVKTTGQDTRSRWFQEKVYSHIDLYATLFFCEGISNGGLFWDTVNIKSDLVVGDCINDSWYQEIFRTLKIIEPIYFDPNVGCVWTQFETTGPDRGSKLPNFLSTSPKLNRATQSILRHLLRVYGDRLVRAAQGVAGNEIDSIELLEHQMLNLLSWNYPFQYVSLPTRLILLIKHFVRHIYTLNEFDTALTSMPIPSR